MGAQILNINGRNLYAEAHGPERGEPVVFLHHGLGSTRSWVGQLSAFAAAGYRVVAYDRWGYGRSDPRPTLDAPEFAADLADLEGLLTQLSLEKPNLVGHSDGGTISLAYAAKRPEAVRNLVVIAAHIYVEAKMIPGVEGIRFAFENEPRFRLGLERLHGAQTEAVFHNWYRAWVQPRQLSWDMRPSLACIACPALVAQGEEDEHATPQHARDLAASITGAQLWLEPGGRHMLPQEQPELFNRRVVQFLHGEDAAA